jgi:hypothetical protein
MRNGKPKPQEQVWIVHVGFTHLVLPDHASAKALISALTKARVVDHDIMTEEYFKAPQYSEKIGFETIPSDKLHLDRERRDEVVDEPLPAKGYPRLSAARQLLLEGK